jgi:hypothetical protein
MDQQIVSSEFKGGRAARVTGRDCEKIAQKIAQSVFAQNLYTPCLKVAKN